MKRAAIIVLGAILGLTACGSSDDANVSASNPSGSDADFCATIEPFNKAQVDAREMDPAKVLGSVKAWDAVAASAPAEAKADADFVASEFGKVTREIEAAGDDRKEQTKALYRAVTKLNVAKLDEAGLKMKAFVKKDCNLELVLVTADAEGEGSDSTQLDSSTVAGRLSLVPATKDLAFSTAITSVMGQTEVMIEGPDLTEAQSMEACEAVADFVFEKDADASIEVGPTEEPPLVVANAKDGCHAA